MKRAIGSLVMYSLIVLVIGVTNAFPLATATATAQAGNNCGSISIPRNVDPGVMEVSKVFINGVETTAYSVVAGTNNSTRPKIKFDPALNANDVVKVELKTKNSGTFTVNLKLETKPRGC